MLVEFRQSLQGRVAEEASIATAREAREKEEQAAWGEVFSAAETLLQEQGHRVGVGLKTSINDKVAMVSEFFSHGLPPPLDFTQTSRIWGLEKEVDFDEEPHRVLILARARLRSPRNADALIIKVEDVELSVKKFPYRRQTGSQNVGVSLSLGGQRVSESLSDANFFKEIISITRQQTSSMVPILPSPEQARLVLRPRWII